MEQIVTFTLVGALLYVFSDRLLDRIERARGSRFPHRSLVFFSLILVLALVSFQLLDRFLG